MAKRFKSIVKNEEDLDANFSKPLFASSTNNIKGLVMEGRRQVEGYEGLKDAPLPLSEISSTEVKDFLRQRVGSLTIEGTINEMYLTIKNMETQLQKVLNINSSLENDLKITKNSLIKVSKDNETLNSKIRDMEEEGPLKAELDRELQQLIYEHNSTMEKIQDIKREKDEVIGKMDSLNKDILRLEEEKDDSLKDALYLQSKIDDLIVRVREHEEHISKLRGENLYYREKIKKQEEEISDIVEERNAIQLELKECKEAFDEIYTALVETKTKTKKFFYQELKGE